MDNAKTHGKEHIQTLGFYASIMQVGNLAEVQRVD